MSIISPTEGPWQNYLKKSRCPFLIIEQEFYIQRGPMVPIPHRHHGPSEPANTPYLTSAASVISFLMMEQAQAGHGHGNSIFIARFDDIVVADRAAGLGDIVDAAAMSRSMLSPKGKKASLPRATP